MNNPHAFPRHPGVAKPYSGMTLRDYFAARAMQGMMVEVDQPACDYIARTAYNLADAMLKAREQK